MASPTSLGAGAPSTIQQKLGHMTYVEVYTQSPWNNPPPRAGEYTSEEEIRQILRSVDIEV